MPVMTVIKKFLDSLTDEVLKKESKTESKNEALTVIIKVCAQKSHIAWRDIVVMNQMSTHNVGPTYTEKITLSQGQINSSIGVK